MCGAQVFHECRVYGWFSLGRKRVTANGAALNLAIGNQVWHRVECLVVLHNLSLRRSRKAQPAQICGP